MTVMVYILTRVRVSSTQHVSNPLDGRTTSHQLLERKIIYSEIAIYNNIDSFGCRIDTSAKSTNI